MNGDRTRNAEVHRELERIESAPDEDLRRVAAIARAMDAAFRVPGTKIRIGWDSILGLVPGVGDLITVGPLVYFLSVGHRRGLPRRKMARMLWNQGIDFAVGSIPLLGDLFDVAFKSNAKNARILEEHLRGQEGGVPRRSR